MDDALQPALVAAVMWVEQAFTGTAGTVVAVLSVATVGLLMLTGRLPARRGATVVFGCFILFSARTIADGLAGSREHVVVPPPAVAAGPAYAPTQPKPVPYDPYAGASVPPPQGTPPIVR